MKAPSKIAYKMLPSEETLDEDVLLAPKDFHVNQSVRVLELTNEDLWIKSSDTSWHLPSVSYTHLTLPTIYSV